MTLNKKIFVTFEREGFHCWPEAPKKVEFLRNLHRHLFCVRAEVSVNHNDREIEFILFKQELERNLEIILELDRRISCEQIGEQIIEYIIEYYGNRKVSVEVSEDRENGAVVDNY